LPELSNGFVVALGIGVVFVGLISIVILCKIVSAFCMIGQKSKTQTKPTTPTKVTQNQPIENRQEIIAAVSAVIAEELGKDVSAIKITSFKKL
jgi:Na+-transporting methylmalonyl-CoA/oxaloacetate decarboxylase gamma subunit